MWCERSAYAEHPCAVGGSIAAGVCEGLGVTGWHCEWTIEVNHPGGSAFGAGMMTSAGSVKIGGGMQRRDGRMVAGNGRTNEGGGGNRSQEETQKMVG